MKHTVSTISALAILVFGAARLEAQPATASAEQLFRDGKRLMTEGNIAAACDAFDGSYRTEPTISTLLNLADCREKNQQYASAWGHFLAAARLARADPSLAPMLETAQRRAAALEPRLSFLIVNVPDDARVDGLTITRNGALVDPAEWNRDIPIDGGTYRIEGKAPAYEAWSATVTVGNAKDKQSVNVPRFSQVPTTASAAPATTTPEPGDRPSTFTAKRKAAVGLWVVGAVGLGSGLALELAARSTYEDAKASTDNTRRHELTASANDQRHYGMGAAAVGLLAVGAGAFLWYSGRPHDRGLAVAPRLDSKHAGLTLVGHF